MLQTAQAQEGVFESGDIGEEPLAEETILGINHI